MLRDSAALFQTMPVVNQGPLEFCSAPQCIGAWPDHALRQSIAARTSAVLIQPHCAAGLQAGGGRQRLAAPGTAAGGGKGATGVARRRGAGNHIAPDMR